MTDSKITIKYHIWHGLETCCPRTGFVKLSRHLHLPREDDDDIILPYFTIFGHVPDYVVSQSSPAGLIKKIDPGYFFFEPEDPCFAPPLIVMITKINFLLSQKLTLPVGSYICQQKYLQIHWIWQELQFISRATFMITFHHRIAIKNSI